MEYKKLDLPEKQIGDWSIKKFEIKDNTPEDGIYTALNYKQQAIMSDTHFEFNTHLDFINKAEGNILVGGLGLGMVLEYITSKENVKKIVVIEKEQEVIDLVWEHYKDKHNDITLIHKSIFDINIEEDLKNLHFDYAWYDIWPTIAYPNIAEMDKLEEKFKSVADFQLSWCRAECELKLNEPTNPINARFNRLRVRREEIRKIRDEKRKEMRELKNKRER